MNCGTGSSGAPTRPSPRIECVVDAPERGHVDVHPLDRRVGRVVDRVRAAHARRRPRRSLERGRASVDGELRFTVENHEHLFAVVVKMRADAGLGLDDPAMQEPQVGVERLAAEHPEVVQAARSPVHARRRAVARWVVVRDALLERQSRRIRRRVGRRRRAARLLRPRRGNRQHTRAEHDRSKCNTPFHDALSFDHHQRLSFLASDETRGRRPGAAWRQPDHPSSSDDARPRPPRPGGCHPSRTGLFCTMRVSALTV